MQERQENIRQIEEGAFNYVLVSLKDFSNYNHCHKEKEKKIHCKVFGTYQLR